MFLKIIMSKKLKTIIYTYLDKVKHADSLFIKLTIEGYDEKQNLYLIVRFYYSICLW